jgi:Icc protein
VKRWSYRVTLAGFVIAIGCLHPAEERASRDLAVGSAETSTASLVVEGGLAAIRSFTDHDARLWAQAPTLRIHARSTSANATNELTLTVDNCLPDAVLTAVGDSGAPVDAVPQTADRPTQKRATFQLPPNASLTIDLRPPDADQPGPFRFAVLSDIQEAIDRVQDIYSRMNQDPELRFVVSAGDLTDGGKPEEMDRFQRELQSLRVPFYATSGNHDIASDDSTFREWFGRGSFHFSYRSVHFTLLDSASATIDPTTYGWLEGWLDDARDAVHVVAMHVPPLDPVGERNASFASRAEAAKLLATVARGNVDLLLYGHIHAYYAFANAGIPAYVSGGGGAHPERMTGIGRHYLTVDVDPQRVLATSLVRVDAP